MANDPNRDVLPVKELADKQKGYEYPSLSKYKRPDLEDKYLRLYEENIDLKRLTNTQNGKIKKLGSKLLRMINERKSLPHGASRKVLEDVSATAELQMKILELEHENYSLKDRNIVLRQQLASHSRSHSAAHRSPIRLQRAQSSPRLTHPQQSVHNTTEGSVSTSNRQASSEMLELRDAEVDITVQNNEIKKLQSENDTLRRELEMSVMTLQKYKLDENIEVIKLRRQNKQLDSQLRNSDHKLKRAQQDLTRLQKENEDALLIITEKQNEVIDLQSKLSTALKLQQELQEMKEIVSDLMGERDCLKERCEALLKTISDNATDASKMTELPIPGNVILEAVGSLHPNNVDSKPTLPNEGCRRRSDSSTQTKEEVSVSGKADVDLTLLKSTQVNRALNVEDRSPYNLMELLSRSNTAANKTATDAFKTLPIEKMLPVVVNKPLIAVGDLKTADSKENLEELLQQSLTSASEKINLQRELERLRDMLRTQTLRCDFQQQEIMRLQQESQLNEIRFKDVFQQRDLFFRLLDQSKIKENPENKKSFSKSSDDNSGCVSTANTYTKNHGGTYTMNSPANESTPTKTKNQKLGSNGNGVGLAEKTPEPAKVPVAAPRTRVEAVPVTSESSRVQIAILWLQFEEGSRLLTDSNIQALYVDFAILGKSSDRFETPRALAKPRSSEERCQFDFTSDLIWDVDMSNRLKALKEKGDSENIIIFNVVNEPPGDASDSIVECAVVGTSTLSLQQFLFSSPDDDLLLPIYDSEDPSKFSGTLAIQLNVSSAVSSLE